MINLQRALQAEIASLTARAVYFRRASETATPPYVVYSLILASGGEHDSIGNVDVDGWDIPADGNTTVIETLMDTLQIGLNKKTIVTSEFAVTLHLAARIPVDDDDSRIERRKLIFEARLIERSI
jgi:hypothetical protein